MNNRLEALQALARKLHRLYAWGRILDCIPARDESIESVKFKLGLKGLLAQGHSKSFFGEKNTLMREYFHNSSLGIFHKKESELIWARMRGFYRNSLVRVLREKESRLVLSKGSGQAGGFHNNLLGIFREGTATRVGNSFWSNSLMKVLKESSVTKQRILATSRESLRRSSSRLDKVFERVKSFGWLGGENMQVPKTGKEIFSSSTTSRIASTIKNSRVQSSIDNRKVFHIANVTIENANISDLETFKMELNSIVGD